MASRAIAAATTFGEEWKKSYSYKISDADKRTFYMERVVDTLKVFHQQGKIPAIKLFKNRSHFGLRDCKKTVEKIADLFNPEWDLDTIIHVGETNKWFDWNEPWMERHIRYPV